jgi:hypothetical protein
MTRVFTFRCNLPTRPQRRTDGRLLALNTVGHNQNVEVVVEDIARVFQKDLSGRIADTLDIAAFVYAADAAIKREGGWIEGAIEPWSRTFRFEIGVRDLQFWKRGEVVSLLTSTLSFLSDDEYKFSFYELRNDKETQGYLNFGPTAPQNWPFQNPSRVSLFSGGLDSLCGAVEQASVRDKIVLVSHRPISLLDGRQQELYDRMRALYPDVPMLRVPVWVHKVGQEAREYTQRSRSFLYWALALAVSHSVNANGITFFENGIVSLNLPIADQVLRARASRTTHPVSLHLLEQLSKLVLDRQFVVDNPYIGLTKTEVFRKIIDNGGGDLIRSSRSCTRTRSHKGVGWHCGCCSQCIDRRIAAIASGEPNLDPESDYATPVLTGKREGQADQNMAVSYARHALELAKSSRDDIAERFNTEISRAARAFPDPTKASLELIDMHLRHGAFVQKVIAESVASHALEWIEGGIDPTSLLGLVVERRHLTTSWKRFCDRISLVLERGLPAACSSRQPDNETHLQQICDGLLRAADENLTREYPFLRWASRMTKPDYSDEKNAVWVELKYIRSSGEVRRVTEEIAADITKYGDNDRRTLFVVYDHGHYIVDEDSFVRDIQRHDGNLIKIIR